MTSSRRLKPRRLIDVSQAPTSGDSQSDRGREQTSGNQPQAFGIQWAQWFKSQDLLEQALTHKSFRVEKNNEVLEFLGDAVWNFLVVDWLVDQYPGASEGFLSRRKSFLVSTQFLSQLAWKLGIPQGLKLAAGVLQKGQVPERVLAGAFEAVLGALYRDRGFEVVRALAHEWLRNLPVPDLSDWDAKTQLQELLQGQWGLAPTYVTEASAQPGEFVSCVWFQGQKLGEGKGPTKKQAEQEAARAALSQGLGALFQSRVCSDPKGD